MMRPDSIAKTAGHVLSVTIPQLLGSSAVIMGE